MKEFEEDHHRFELLDAGRALGDLTREEEEEWRELADERELFREEADLSFDDLVAALEENFTTPNPIPRSLTSSLESGMIPFSNERSSPSTAVPTKAINLISWIQRPAAGWAIAACLAIFWALPNASPPSAEKLARALESVSSTVQAPFAGMGDYESLEGDVLWSDDQQTGFLRLQGLTPNDPAKAQYQLWIVDANQGRKHPVDGGVFDAPSDSLSVTIPIDSKLLVSEPTVFVITLEQPGGVVVSDQETVVAIAKTT
ncbi:MAG: anti-sigma factor [Verrucomicrobiota bacterium]